MDPPHWGRTGVSSTDSLGFTGSLSGWAVTAERHELNNDSHYDDAGGTSDSEKSRVFRRLRVVFGSALLGITFFAVGLVGVLIGGPGLQPGAGIILVVGAFLTIFPGLLRIGRGARQLVRGLKK